MNTERQDLLSWISERRPKFKTYKGWEVDMFAEILRDVRAPHPSRGNGKLSFWRELKKNVQNHFNHKDVVREPVDPCEDGHVSPLCYANEDLRGDTLEGVVRAVFPSLYPYIFRALCDHGMYPKTDDTSIYEVFPVVHDMYLRHRDSFDEWESNSLKMWVNMTFGSINRFSTDDGVNFRYPVRDWIVSVGNAILRSAEDCCEGAEIVYADTDAVYLRGADAFSFKEHFEWVPHGPEVETLAQFQTWGKKRFRVLDADGNTLEEKGMVKKV